MIFKIKPAGKAVEGERKQVTRFAWLPTQVNMLYKNSNSVNTDFHYSIWLQRYKVALECKKFLLYRDLPTGGRLYALRWEVVYQYIPFKEVK